MTLCACGCGQPVLSIAKRNGRGYFKGQPMRLIQAHFVPKPLEERFWEKVNKEGPIPTHCPELGQCWLWTGGQDGRGRGSLWVYEENTKCKAPRVAWFIETGKWPNPMALHKCDNGLCVRFSHLFEGTQSDNMRDCAEKGRLKNQYIL